MKNYSNYHMDSKTKFLADGMRSLEITKSGFDGVDVVVNGVPKRIIIRDKYSSTKIQKVAIDNKGSLNFGDIIEVTSIDEKWIIVDRERDNPIYEEWIILKCLSSLKWINEEGDIQEAYFAYRVLSPTNFGFSDDRILVLGNERRQIIIQYNEETKEIYKGQRFIFDENAWKVTAIDRLESGIIHLTLEEDELNASKDNLDLRIADYYDKIPDYSIFILNGEQLSIDTNQTIQLKVEVKNRGVLISNPELVYSVSDETIVSIDENGLITPLQQGQVTVTVFYKNLSAAIVVNVTDVVTHNYFVEIIGNSTVKVNSTNTYSCVFRDNGEAISESGIFSITAVDGISPTDLASIISQNPTNNTCVISIGKKTGTFILHVQNSDGTITNEVQIKINPLF